MHSARPTSAQHEVLVALNLRQMQGADSSEIGETGVMTGEVASACGRSKRSTAVILSQMRDFGWVASTHDADFIGWWLLEKGVAVLEATREQEGRDRG